MLTLLLTCGLLGCGALNEPAPSQGADGDPQPQTNSSGSSQATPPTFRAIDQTLHVPSDSDSSIALTYETPSSQKVSFELVARPRHGVLSGTPPQMTYAPTNGFAGEDRFTFRVRQGEKTSEAAVVLYVSTWTPPIGIPMPSFGIFETIADQYGDAKFQTHYVDNTNPQATDTDNPNGTVNRPRESIPTDLPAGSVVVVAGGPYTYRIGGTIPINARGTEDRPVYLRGADPDKPPHFGEGVTMTGQYLIVEDVVFDGGNPLFVKDGPHHMALRRCEVTKCGGPAVQLSAWDGVPVHDIVIYDCKIHDNGNVKADFDEDYHGIGVGSGVYNLWVVDNQLYRNSGDGIQINAGNSAARSSTHHIYVGRNNSYANKQTGMWCKQATDVVFSQNDTHHHAPSNSSPGAGMGCQYDPDRIWFLFNRVHHCDYGIVQMSGADNASNEASYMIGNLIYDIYDSDGDFNPNTSWSNAGIMVVGGVHRYIVNNTIVRADGGIHGASTFGDFTLTNNIVAEISQRDGKHVFLEHAEPSRASSMQNCLFDQTLGALRFVWGGQSYNNARSIAVYQDHVSGCIVGNPTFDKESKTSLHLQAGSKAIDAGVDSGVYDEFEKRYGISIKVDIDATARPIGSKIDIGADEF